MTKLSVRFALILLLFAGAATARAADVKLALLQTVPADPAGRFEILVKPEPQGPKTPIAAGAWRLGPGEPLRAKSQPGDRLIELYSGTPGAPILLCRVLVRFLPSPKGWVPYFLLDEQPLVARVNGRWKPLELAPGVPAQLVQRLLAMPTADGFYPALEFGLASGPLTIIGWTVR